MHKYHAISSFYIWPAICSVATGAIRESLLERGAGATIPDFERFWSDLCRFIEMQHAHGKTVDAILGSTSGMFEYDIPAWLSDQMPNDPTPYRHASPKRFHFDLAPEGQAGLASALEVWSASVRGLSKMVTRINALWQHRRVTQVAEKEYLCQTA
jgi:hypothetical protein